MKTRDRRPAPRPPRNASLRHSPPRGDILTTPRAPRPLANHRSIALPPLVNRIVCYHLEGHSSPGGRLTVPDTKPHAASQASAYGGQRPDTRHLLPACYTAIPARG